MQEKHWTPAQSPSKESSESMFSFSAASSLLPLRWGIPYVYGSTVMLQQISSMEDGVTAGRMTAHPSQQTYSTQAALTCL